MKKCIVIPVATGMALSLCLLTLRKHKPNAKYVIWSRIDQKSCFKCIITAGYTPVVIETKLVDEHFETDLDLMKQEIQTLGVENILCLFSTTSCFAPRYSDKF